MSSRTASALPFLPLRHSATTWRKLPLICNTGRAFGSSATEVPGQTFRGWGRTWGGQHEAEQRGVRGLPWPSQPWAASSRGVSVAGAAELRADAGRQGHQRRTPGTSRRRRDRDRRHGHLGLRRRRRREPQRPGRPAEPATADPGWETFSTDYASAAARRSPFTKPGTYKFVCGAHAATMIGTVDGHRRPVVTPTATATATAEPTAERVDHAATDGHAPTPTATATPCPVEHRCTTPAPTGAAPRWQDRPALTKV